MSWAGRATIFLFVLIIVLSWAFIIHAFNALSSFEEAEQPVRQEYFFLCSDSPFFSPLISYPYFRAYRLDLVDMGDDVFLLLNCCINHVSGVVRC